MLTASMATDSRSTAEPRAIGTVTVASSLLEGIEKRGVLWALAAGLLARVLMITIQFHWTSVPNSSDDQTYVRFAHTVLETGGLPTHHFPVGYPLFVAPFFLLGDAAFPAIRLVHVL